MSNQSSTGGFIVAKMSDVCRPTPVEAEAILEKARRILWESNLTVKESPINGRGVFTIGEIPANVDFCYYDGYWRDEKDMTAIEARYALNIGEKKLVGFIHPKRKHGVAQLFNDVACPDFKQVNPAADIPTQLCQIEQLEIDYIKAWDKSNVSHDESDMVFYTRRKINPGEELTFCYGFNYWLNESNAAMAKQIWMKAPGFELLVDKCIASAIYESLIEERTTSIIRSLLEEANFIPSYRQTIGNGVVLVREPLMKALNDSTLKVLGTTPFESVIQQFDIPKYRETVLNLEKGRWFRLG